MHYIRSALLALTLTHALTAWAVDLQPNDIVAPPPNKNFITVSYYNTENSTFYSNGAVNSKTSFASPVIDTQSAILRGARTYTLADLPAVSYIQLPYGSVRPAGSLSSAPTDTGFGDLVLATAIWPYANKATRTYVGVGGYLIAPMGSYSSGQAFNLAENRFRTDLQIGFQTPIVGGIDGMIAVDTMWFGGNSQCAAACNSTSDNVSLTQKPLTTTQLGPIYRINEIFTVGASYIYAVGGATSINNTYMNNVVNTQRFLLSGQAHTPIGRFSLQYGRDMEIKNGFIQTRVLAVRLMKDF
ncbi:transporter [Polynucleobacter sp. AP-Nino-20-G2]|uniref:transporter n=1 Tax=Polynucleobacter sp. AP-Nino-20-G2 TaxID=2576917 RepID=UPI001BFDBEE0|nr:transporter [Polynucleobacter sp. AP-Nino-20-G2]QWE16207.1 transporter [Polynucleobacter sp. AP-Nino-20-G2]